MKKCLLFLVSSCFFVVCAQAQDVGSEKPVPPRKSYVNLSYVNQSMTVPDFGSGKMTTDYGAAFTVGHTYYLHRKPIGRVLYFGLDATWCDLNYGHYSTTYVEEDYESSYEEKLDLHQAEIGMQVGPSVTVAPVSRLKVHGYFRFAPSFAATYDNSTFRGNYGSFFVTGLSVSYGVIGLGIEKRWGSCKYKEFGGGGDDEGKGDYEDPDYESTTSSVDKIKTSGFRAYLTFRF